MFYFILYILSREWLALTVLFIGLFLAYKRKSSSLALMAVLLFLTITSIFWYPQFSPWFAFPFLFLVSYLFVKRYRWVLYPALALGLLLLAVSPILGIFFTVYVPVNHYAYLEEKGQTVVVREDYYGAFFSESDIEITTYVNGQLPLANKIVYKRVALHDFNKNKDVNKDIFLAQPLTRERLEELKDFINKRNQQRR
ncbi:hypothetical protein [Streptococcus gordonii]|jgi:hypothetical protein|uniref:hypothetical protein n=1 Tax=Streptococcus gordonii TaxID=1302 RepID=UPI00073BDF34|nr:hypothetical protein [Streptococcus gordonii]KTF20885.1 hypothetical protein AT460_03200 [Streptococcus gordonii]KXC03234.1 hypothetical protein AWH02_04450 [Streptococcus gordonii]MBZ2149900.1 hypothetical protein [Streptococcus gordonii]QWZ58618.1 hypothetical protein I6L84_05220 [Streptococcus gordonii]SQF28530.1 Uncharacterised protein [Streptococcus gordonii]